jgi:hypothetical protein
MSQIKGIKIPIMPQTVYPFWKVSIHTVKSSTIYKTKSELARIHSRIVMMYISPFFREHLPASVQPDFACDRPAAS